MADGADEDTYAPTLQSVLDKNYKWIFVGGKVGVIAVERWTKYTFYAHRGPCDKCDGSTVSAAFVHRQRGRILMTTAV